MKVGSYGMDMVNAAKLNQNVTKDIKSDEDKDLMESCVKLEGEFMKIMLKEMKKTIPDSGFVPKSAGHDIVEDFDTDQPDYIFRGTHIELSAAMARVHKGAQAHLGNETGFTGSNITVQVADDTLW